MCPAQLVADIAPEPMPPAGVSARALHDLVGDAFFQWLAVDYPTWARELERRLMDAKAACGKTESKGR